MLRLGKIRENVLKRSVLKEIKNRRKEVLVGSSLGEDAAVVAISEKDAAVLSTDPITVNTKEAAGFSVYNAVNDIAAMGGEPIGILLSILLPEESDESLIKSIIRDSENVCDKLGIQIIGGHTEVTKAVNYPVITVTGVGKIQGNDYKKTSGAEVGDDVVVSKWIGLEGTCIIAREKKSLLCDNFPSAFVENACCFDELLAVIPELEILKKCSISSFHDIASGGIFASLWEMAEASKKGLEIDLKKIPVRQETIEISEVFGINPYELHSGGSMLITAKDGQQIVMELEKAGINAEIIGKVTAGADRILRNDDEIRYLEPPKADEIYKVL